MKLPEAGSIVAGKYEVIGVIGEGGQGFVVEARQTALDRIVALKFVHPHLLGDESVVARFEREARNAARLSSAYAARVYDVERTAEGVPFIVSERLEGRSLLDEVTERGPLPIQEAVDYAIETCAALAEAHALGIVHRDVKPSNVFIVNRGAKLLDFGVSKVHGTPDVTGVGMVVGSPRFMAPEQIHGSHQVDARADVWSAAVVLFYALTGAHPFEGATANEVLCAILAEAPRTPRSFRPEVPEALERVVLRALDKNAASRTPTMAHLARQLRPFGSDAVTSAVFARGPLADALREQETAVTRDAASTPPPASRTNLAPSRTTFVGRSAEIDELGKVARGPARLVTLVGPGGIGKTTLARRWGELRLDAHDSVFFCDLTDSSDLQTLCGAVGRALGVSLVTARSSEDAVAQLGEHIARGHVLLILDNCEQVVKDAAFAVGRWMEAAPRATFLATSREALRVDGEQIFEVRPLSDPEAVQLFVDRARSARHDYTVGEAETAVVTGIVRDLDGLPLAIELAAARMNVMSASSLAENMARRFELLTSRRRDASARQQTLRATLDWSYDLLRPWEQAALAQCSLFRGGFTIEAAEAVVDVSAFAGAPSVLEVVQALRDKSLIHTFAPRDAPSARSELRLRLYESIREYAAERLVDTGATERFVAYFAHGGARWSAEALARGSASARAQLLVEADNFMTAHRFALERRASAAAFETMFALDWVLDLRGPFAQHLPLLDATFAAGEPSDASLRAKLLVARGRARWRRALMSEAWDDCETAAVLARDAGDLFTQGRALLGLGNIAAARGRVEESQTHFEAALAIFRQGRYTLPEAFVLNNLAGAHFRRGENDEAVALYTQAIALGRELDHPTAIARALANLGQVLQEQGRFEEARQAYDEALELSSGADRLVVSFANGCLATLLHESGKPEEARRHYAIAVAVARETAHPISEGMFMAARGALEAAMDRGAEAASLLDRADALAQASGAAALASAVRLHRGHVDLARARHAASHGGDPERHIAEARRRLGEESPPDGDVRFARRLLERALEAIEPPALATLELVVGPQGRWFEVGGKRTELKRKQHRILLLALARQSVAAREAPLPIEQLIRIVWPGQRMVGESGKHRVHVLVSALRNEGLREAIRRDVDGYLFEPTVRIVLRE